MTAPRASVMSPRATGLWAFLALVLGLLGWTACVGNLNRGHAGNLMDDGLYLVSAQALRDGSGYSLPSHPGPPVRSRYPIGVPGLLALAMWLAPGSPSLTRDLAVCRAVIVALAWVFFVASYTWLRWLRVSPWLAVLLVWATAFHLATVSSAVVVMADLPFAALAAVLMARWAVPRSEQLMKGPERSIVNGALAGLATLVRANGVSLVAAALVAAWVDSPRRRRLAAVLTCLAGISLAFGPLNAYAGRYGGSRMSPGYNSVLTAGWQSIGTGLRTTERNIVESALTLPSVITPIFGTKYASAYPAIFWGLRIAIGLALLAGGIRLVRLSRLRDLPVWAHAAATFAIFWVWPWHFGAARLLSLFPAILWAFTTGVGELAKMLGASSPLARKIGTMAVVLMLASSLTVTGRVLLQASARGGAWTDPRDKADLDAVFSVIRAKEPDAIIVSMTPEMVYLYTGRQGIMMMEDNDQLLHQLGRSEAILATLREFPERPFYLLSAPPESNETLGGEQASALVRDPALELKEIYRAPNNLYWLAAMSIRQSNSPIK
jgi:hypothetical protein